jgi:Mn-containing catalase
MGKSPLPPVLFHGKTSRRSLYLLDFIDVPEVAEPIKFLRERKIVHFKRFGECLRKVEEYLGWQRYFYQK